MNILDDKEYQHQQIIVVYSLFLVVFEDIIDIFFYSVHFGAILLKQLLHKQAHILDIFQLLSIISIHLIHLLFQRIFDILLKFFRCFLLELRQNCILVFETLLSHLYNFVILADCFDDGVDVSFIEERQSLQLMFEYLDLFLWLSYFLLMFLFLLGLLFLSLYIAHMLVFLRDNMNVRRRLWIKIQIQLAITKRLLQTLRIKRLSPFDLFFFNQSFLSFSHLELFIFFFTLRVVHISLGGYFIFLFLAS